MFEQKGQGRVDRRSVKDVVVVQDEDAIVGNGGKFVEQQRQQRLAGGRLWRLEQRQHLVANVRRSGLQGSDKVRQKADGVAVAVV